MTMTTKPCMSCRQPIDEAASKCQHCHQIQSPLFALQTRPAAQVVLAVVVMGVFAAAMYSLYSASTKPLATPNLRIGASTLRMSTVDDEPRVLCFADMSNPGPHVWSNVSLQAEFFDAKRTRIDVLYQQHRVSIYPSLGMVGRVSGTPGAAAAQYASCRISVTGAS